MRHILFCLIYFASLCDTYCLLESEKTIGFATEGEVFSNKDEIEALGPENHSFHSFTTCVDDNAGILSGIQYNLISD